MNSSPDETDYGPLAILIGTWAGPKGLDVAPDINCDPRESEYNDQLTFTGIGDVDNAEEQDLVGLKYQHIVRRNKNGVIFHDQVGYWIYEPATGLVMHSISIPRAVCLLAGGSVRTEDGESVFEVEAKQGSETFGILQSPFMAEKARTTAFHMRMAVKGDELEYCQTTSLFIYGKSFEHTDESRLKRIS